MKTQKSAKVAAVCLIEGLESRQFLTVTTDTTVPTDVIMSDPGVIVGLPIDTGTTDTGSTDSGSTDGGIMTDPTLNSDPTGSLMDPSSDGSGTVDVPVTDPTDIPTDVFNGTDPVVYQSGIETLNGGVTPRNTGNISPNQRNLHGSNANHKNHRGAWNGLNSSSNSVHAANNRKSNVKSAAKKAPTQSTGGVTFTAVATRKFTQQVGSFNQQTVDIIFTAKISWGDGTTSNATMSGGLLNGGNFTVNGIHTYAKTGTYQVTTQVFSSVAPNTKLKFKSLTIQSIATVMGNS